MYRVFVFMCKLHSISHYDYLKKMIPVTCKSLHFMSNFRLCCTRSLYLGFEVSLLHIMLRVCVLKSLQHIFPHNLLHAFVFVLAGIISLLEEPMPELKVFALKKLDLIVDEFWPEISEAIEKM